MKTYYTDKMLNELGIRKLTAMEQWEEVALGKGKLEYYDEFYAKEVKKEEAKKAKAEK